MSVINSDSAKNNIYINENLTKRNKKLFKKARDLKRNGDVKYAWCKNGKIFIRKTDDSKVIVFNDNVNVESI